jgi:hypothetical protein
MRTYEEDAFEDVVKSVKTSIKNAGRDISDAQAVEAARNLENFCRVVLKIRKRLNAKKCLGGRLRRWGAGDMTRKTIYLNGKEIGEYESTGDDLKDMQIIDKRLREKGLINKPPCKISSMKWQADSFAATAQDLYRRDLSLTPIKNIYSLTPFIVNAAFSIEVYLKIIYKINGKEAKGHDLWELYDHLPKEAKDSILVAAQDVRPDYKHSDGADFLSCLSSLRNSFVKWRYVYEHDYLQGPEVQSVRYIMHSMHEACCRAMKIAGLA